MKFLNNIDLAKNQLLNAVIQNLASAPSSPVEGQTYYNTVNKSAYTYDGTIWVPHDGRKLAAGTLPIAVLATDPLARGNHTGTQLAATVSDFNNAVRTNRLDQLLAPTATVNMGGQIVSNVAAPSAASDAANKQYVDDNIAGLSWKDEVEAATIGPIPLSGNQTVDAVAITPGMRVLVKDQAAPATNGIYISSAGAWSRSPDANLAAEISGAVMFVKNGSNAGQRFVCTTAGDITLDTTAINFGVFGGGSTYTAGNGLSLSTSTFAVLPKTNGGLAVDGTGVFVDTAIVARKFSVTIGDAVATSIVVTHNLNTKDVQISVRQVADDVFVECDMASTSVNTCTLTFAVAPATGALRVTVLG
jgi:hypothetical protein